MTDAINLDTLNPQESASNPVRSLGGPNKMRAVTLGTDFGEYATWIYVGVTTNLVYLDWTRTSVTLTNLLGGSFHPIHAVQIVSTSAGAATDLKWGN